MQVSDSIYFRQVRTLSLHRGSAFSLILLLSMGTAQAAPFGPSGTAGDNKTQNIYGPGLQKNEFNNSKIYTGEEHPLQHNYFGAPVQQPEPKLGSSPKAATSSVPAPVVRNNERRNTSQSWLDRPGEPESPPSVVEAPDLLLKNENSVSRTR